MNYLYLAAMIVAGAVLYIPLVLLVDLIYPKPPTEESDSQAVHSDDHVW